MNYQETLAFMFNSLPMYQRQGKAAYKDNLDNSLAFDQYLDQPHKNYKTIHVAGTNGKGSSSHMLASVLQEAGYKTGLYTSPHLKDFRERIKVDGAMVSEDFVVEFIEKHKLFIEKLQPSFFEMTVFMAFEYFKNQNVDIAVIETGMGGRLDSTNLICPLVSVITNISLDHTQFLGDTIQKIAIEKAGIIKEGVPVIIGESHPNYDAVFIEKANEMSTSCIFADQTYRIDFVLKSIDGMQVFDISENGSKAFEQIKLDLLGHYQQKNILSVIATLEAVSKKINISKTNIYAGLKNVISNTNLQGRWQTIGVNPLMICDTGHNEAGVQLVLEQIKNTAFEQLHIVWGMVNDKSIDRILEMLPKKAHYYFTKAQIPRALNEQNLYQAAQQFGLKGEAYLTINEALNAAKLKAKNNDLILIGGSTFVVAEVV